MTVTAMAIAMAPSDDVGCNDRLGHGTGECQRHANAGVDPTRLSSSDAAAVSQACSSAGASDRRAPQQLSEGRTTPVSSRVSPPRRSVLIDGTPRAATGRSSASSCVFAMPVFKRSFSGGG